mmetsp:Transcript_10395/g.18672  ORF Transcript_10395/g.18672 Transcript_10395/m.18672 type:complete len:355 (+) Transcript_10395:56-1120(+)
MNSSASRSRDRKRRREAPDGEGEKHRRHKHKHRDGDRRRHKDGEGSAAQPPPSDWRGPPPSQRGPPPSDWRGPQPGEPPAEWRGPPGGPPGYPPPRPLPPGMSAYPPPYGWPMGGYSHQPPIDWRGPPGSAHPSDPWGARPPAPWGPPAGLPPAEPIARAATEADRNKGNEADMAKAAPEPLSSAADSAGATGRNGTADDQADDDLDAVLGLPPPKTPLERLRDMRIVRSALSQRMLVRLRTAGVTVDGIGQQSLKARTDMLAEVGSSLGSHSSKAACARLGLDASTEQVAAVPMPASTSLSIPACTAGLSHEGLWDRFRKVCGMAVPSTGPAVAAAELRNSRGGGQVAAPVGS